LLQTPGLQPPSFLSVRTRPMLLSRFLLSKNGYSSSSGRLPSAPPPTFFLRGSPPKRLPLVSLPCVMTALFKELGAPFHLFPLESCQVKSFRRSFPGAPPLKVPFDMGKLLRRSLHLCRPSSGSPPTSPSNTTSLDTVPLPLVLPNVTYCKFTPFFLPPTYPELPPRPHPIDPLNFSQ